jgi:hypothetical protein
MVPCPRGKPCLFAGATLATPSVCNACMEHISSSRASSPQNVTTTSGRMSQITAQFRAAGAHRLPHAGRDGLILQSGAIDIWHRSPCRGGDGVLFHSPCTLHHEEAGTFPARCHDCDV